MPNSGPAVATQPTSCWSSCPLPSVRSYTWTLEDFELEVPNADGEYRTWRGGTRAKEAYAAFRQKWPDRRHIFAGVGAWSDGLALTKMGRVTGHPTIITSMNIPWRLRFKPNFRVCACACEAHDTCCAVPNCRVPHPALSVGCVCWPSQRVISCAPLSSGAPEAGNEATVVTQHTYRMLLSAFKEASQGGLWELGGGSHSIGGGGGGGLICFVDMCCVTSRNRD